MSTTTPSDQKAQSVTTAESFPTRQYSYSALSGTGRAPSGFADAPMPSLAPGVYRFKLGRDTAPQALPPEKVLATLHDPFAQLVLGVSKMPTTLRELLKVIDALNPSEQLPRQRSFVVADGGQIPWSEKTRNVARQFRFLITRSKDGALPDLFVSTSRDIDSSTTFLQVVGWDPSAGAFQFYDRREKAWIWAGSSWDALEQDTRGRGPFDSHVNGALNMKELKLPWINWNSQAAQIDSALAPDDPLRKEPVWQAREGAELLEREIIRPNIERWTDSRLKHRTNGSAIERFPELLGQILITTTINLIASPDQSSTVRSGHPVRLPVTFFINTDALLNVLGLDPDISVPTVDGGIYDNCLQRFAVAVTDGTERFAGDTHFVFVVPEVAFEDIAILRRLLDQKIISRKLAAALLMVDFCNPVFSPRRAALIRYVPATVQIAGADDFDTALAQAVEAGAVASRPDSPEQEFLANWRLSDETWRPVFESRIKAFLDAISLKVRALDDFSEIFRLAESRRREFRRRPLAEFRLTTPVTNIPEEAPFLEFAPDASIRQKYKGSIPTDGPDKL